MRRDHPQRTPGDADRPATDNGAVDVVVIGGGIAGVSLAYELAVDRQVLVIEMEDSLGYHATGRSAAMFLETYGGSDIRALTTASRAFFEEPPGCFDTPLMTPRAMVQFAAPGRGARVQELFDELSFNPTGRDLKLLDADQVKELCPIARTEAVESGLLEPNAQELDVHALHQGYIRGLRARAAAIQRSSRADRFEKVPGGWRVHCAEATYVTALIVNAAGAWADCVAETAGCAPVGLTPLRRTAFTIAVDDDKALAYEQLPMLYDIDESFYIKPEGTQMLCSPADRTPCEPQNVKPDELEIARALERIRETTILDPRSIRSSWAGLRTFSPDGNLVVGPDSHVDGFFWCAAQGGYGIQTAPAVARLGAALIRGEQTPADLIRLGIAPKRLFPERFAN
ncbi:NAD(P)/FAD-dependent oxidoreductase [Mycobacterium sp.]|uniref:NAD(P)/FAD-dependent oxidoreductase n=1 Tax=Mycobacterium sp. TaxID=1785 RepID=UPI003BA9D2E7